MKLNTRSKSKKWPLIVGTVAALAIAGGGYLYYTGTTSDDTSNAETQEPQSGVDTGNPSNTPAQETPVTPTNPDTSNDEASDPLPPENTPEEEPSPTSDPRGGYTPF